MTANPARTTSRRNSGHERARRSAARRSPGSVPNEGEAEATFEHTEAESLDEATDLTDDEGDDVRRYTGEPVPTEHGNVIPRQMAVGSDATVGGGEWPDAPPRGVDDDDESGGGGR